MNEPKLIFRIHAIKRMSARGLSETDVRDVLENGEIIEQDSLSTPMPKRPMLAWIEIGGPPAVPIHVVSSFDLATDTIVVITAYEPEASRWTNGFRKRRAPS